MNFFDPNAHSSALFEMGGPGHIVLVLIMPLLLVPLILFRKDLPRLRASRNFMAGTAAFILSIELLSYAFKFIYPCVPAYERWPLHLCSSLKFLITILILFSRYDLVKYFSIWAIGSGFISFANLGLGGESFGNYAFWHYLLGHYYLFLLPIFLFLTGDFRYDLRYHTVSMLGLIAWSLVIFVINWVFDANYMYTGPHNDVAVPFIPDRLMVWPLNYFSYMVVGLVMLTSIYAILRFFQARLDAVAPVQVV